MQEWRLSSSRRWKTEWGWHTHIAYSTMLCFVADNNCQGSRLYKAGYPIICDSRLRTRGQPDWPWLQSKWSCRYQTIFKYFPGFLGNCSRHARFQTWITIKFNITQKRAQLMLQLLVSGNDTCQWNWVWEFMIGQNTMKSMFVTS